MQSQASASAQRRAVCISSFVLLAATYTALFASGLFELTSSTQYAAVAVLKALPVAFLSRSLAQGGRYRTLVSAGLACGAAGDLFLALEQVFPAAFIAGLLSFAVGHVLYIRAFVQHHFASLPAAFSLSFVGIAALRLLLPNMQGKPDQEPLQIPLVVYALLLCSAAYFAGTRRVSRADYSFTTLGALLFLVSDLILAWDRFRSPLPYAHLWVMLTYYSAQLLICSGASRSSVDAAAKPAAAPTPASPAPPAPSTQKPAKQPQSAAATPAKAEKEEAAAAPSSSRSRKTPPPSAAASAKRAASSTRKRKQQ